MTYYRASFLIPLVASLVNHAWFRRALHSNRAAYKQVLPPSNLHTSSPNPHRHVLFLFHHHHVLRRSCCNLSHISTALHFHFNLCVACVSCGEAALLSTSHWVTCVMWGRCRPASLFVAYMHSLSLPSIPLIRHTRGPGTPHPRGRG
jgi:hypothetical protein